MKIIGITGGVGAGKTQILEYLNNKYGATICMADEVGKKLQKKGTECFDEIVAHFGEEILDEKGELDRKKLSDIVFADRVELSVLNGIVHPRVKEEIQKKIAKEERKNTNLMLIEGALLIEDHYEEICDELWYVYVEDSIRRKRLKYARGYEDSKVDLSLLVSVWEVLPLWTLGCSCPLLYAAMQHPHHPYCREVGQEQ